MSTRFDGILRPSTNDVPTAAAYQASFGVQAEKGTLVHRTAHFVVVTTRGGAYHNRGAHYVPGDVMVCEIGKPYADESKTLRLSAPVWRRAADRHWRRHVKEAIAVADQMEADWAAMDAARTANAELAKLKAAQDETRRKAIDALVESLEQSERVGYAVDGIVRSVNEPELGTADLYRAVGRAIARYIDAAVKNVTPGR